VFLSFVPTLWLIPIENPDQTDSSAVHSSPFLCTPKDSGKEKEKLYTTPISITFPPSPDKQSLVSNKILKKEKKKFSGVISFLE
jgi:hypothetical protein